MICPRNRPALKRISLRGHFLVNISSARNAFFQAGLCRRCLFGQSQARSWGETADFGFDRALSLAVLDSWIKANPSAFDLQKGSGENGSNQKQAG